jgi:hypothetical protein
MSKRFRTTKIRSITDLILILTIATTLMTFMPTVNADGVPTIAFITVTPSPIGVGQTATVVTWLSVVPPCAGYDGPQSWEGYTVEITKPDGSKETIGPYDSDPVGSQWLQYTPNQLGTYTFKFTFPGQHVTGTGRISKVQTGDIDWDYAASSDTATLTVQQEPLTYLPDTPLPDPNQYWERPITGENRNWGTIAGNWLMRAYDTTYRSHLTGSAFAPYTKAPNTAHVVWAKEVAFGGIIGGEFGSTSYYSGLSYEVKLYDKIIMNGRIYYESPDPPLYGLYCVDLRTGETIWYQNHTISGLLVGQIYDYESPNQHGGIPYLWDVGSTYKMYDAFTGNLILTMENGTSTSRNGFAFSEKGDLLLYILNGRNNWLAMWNSSKAIPTAAPSGTSFWQWRPDRFRGTPLDWRDGIEWNVTVPDVPGSQSILTFGEGVLVASVTIPRENPTDPQDTYIHIGYSIKEGEEGKQLWVYNRTIPPGTTIYPYPGWQAEGVYTQWDQDAMQSIAYDIYTGEQLWITEPYENPWAMYETGRVIAYGKYYHSSYDGCIHAHDIETGEELWTYYTGNAGFETPYGHWPIYGGLVVADEKIYAATGEHSPGTPLWRGEAFHCVDAETGEEIWNITGWWHHSAIADGYLIALNVADNRLYCFGKGKTTTTVSAAPKVTSWGSNVLIEGTVTDQSPGAVGTPAIADEYMSEWMEYLYMQQPCPQNVQGVEVKLETLDPNGNFYEIGTVTSDASGMYKLLWEPPVPGEYTIIATFKGSESYWSSFAETAIGVTEAPSPAQSMEPELTAPESVEATEAPLITTEIAIIVAVAVACIIGIVAFWAIRKRK